MINSDVLACQKGEWRNINDIEDNNDNNMEEDKYKSKKLKGNY